MFPKLSDLVVFSDKVTEPVTRRYFIKNLFGNVRNVYGQPLVSFRTDDW